VGPYGNWQLGLFAVIAWVVMALPGAAGPAVFAAIDAPSHRMVAGFVGWLVGTVAILLIWWALLAMAPNHQLAVTAIGWLAVWSAAVAVHLLIRGH
jgi:hypothetical protein